MTANKEERFVIANGLNEIFISIGILIFAYGFTYMVVSYRMYAQMSTFVCLALIFGLALVWGLSEVLTIKMKMVAPSILLCLLFNLGAFSFGEWGFYNIGKLFNQTKILENIEPLEKSLSHAIICVFWFCGAGLFLKRFKLPFAVIPLLMSVFFIVIYLIDHYFPKNTLFLTIILALLGAAIFIVGIWLDAQDVERTTIKSDYAFWLHFIAAPTIMAVFFYSLTDFSKELSLTQSFVIILFVFIFGLIALMIDRRAPLVSSLTYLGYAFFNLSKTTEMGGDPMIFTLLFLGASVIFLGILWQQIRRIIMTNCVSKRFHSSFPSF